MSHPSNNLDVAAELVFDVTKPAEDTKFLGLIAGLDGRQHELTGLFDWTCAGCTFHNRSSTIIEPEQAFLTRWLCASCGRVTLVRFRARADAEWVVQHALAIAGDALDDPTGAVTVPPGPAAKAKSSREHGQGIFALVAIPALALIIFLGLNDLQPLRSCLAHVLARAERQSAGLPSSRLPGYWVSESGDHTLCFGRIDPASNVGTYVPILKSHEPCRWVRFTIVREEMDGEELIIRELDGQGDTTVHSNTTLYLPKEGGIMIRAKTVQEKPVFTVYRPISYTRVRQGSARPGS